MTIDATLIVLEGEFDLGDAERLADAFEIAASDSATIVDLNRTAFIDSTVLSQLVKLRTSMAERGSRLLLTQPTGIVWRLFEVTHVRSLFEIRPSVHAILAELELERAATKCIMLVGGRESV